MEVILITSGKGGTGKSTFTANAANILARKGHKTCIIDLDFSLGKVDLLLGLESKIEFDISHVINHNHDVLNAIAKDKHNENLFILASPKSNENILINYEKMATLIETLKRNNFEYVLLDSPPGVNKDNPAKYITDLITSSIVITNQDKMALRDADRIIGILEGAKKQRNSIHLVINKYKKSLITPKNPMKAKEVERVLDVPLLGIISYNNKYSNAVNKGVLASNQSLKIKNEFHNICSEIEKQKK